MSKNYDLMRASYEEIILGLQSELNAYKITLEYFAREGGQSAVDIIANLLKELEG